jgi:hypothetical protein
MVSVVDDENQARKIKLCGEHFNEARVAWWKNACPVRSERSQCWWRKERTTKQKKKKKETKKMLQRNHRNYFAENEKRTLQQHLKSGDDTGQAKKNE